MICAVPGPGPCGSQPPLEPPQPGGGRSSHPRLALLRSEREWLETTGDTKDSVSSGRGLGKRSSHVVCHGASLVPPGSRRSLASAGGIHLGPASFRTTGVAPRQRPPSIPPQP